MKKILLFIIAIALIYPNASARDGMWIPILLKKYNIDEMHKMGFKLSAEDIYSINKITNHHCGFGSIQKHSSVEHDYLTNGFWAKNRSEELPNPNLKVTFLKYMKDVTKQVLEGVTDKMTEEKRNEIIEKNIDEITAKATKGTNYKADVETFYHGNQYFLFVNEVFWDVRLVGAPPSAIGKFGGDTDNWMWPRHTGDFSLFRIYANKDNQPAKYSKDNVPYKPKKYFPISLKGVKENDFTMVFGYPGSTQEYVPSYHLKMITKDINPHLIDLRTKKLDIIKKYSNQDKAVRIKYAAKQARIANSWKRWKGEIKGLGKLDAIKKKQSEEFKFQKWANAYNKKDYTKLLDNYKELYDRYTEYKLAYSYIVEVIYRNGMELAMAASYFGELGKACQKDSINNEKISDLKTKLIKKLDTFYKDYYMPLDKEMVKALLTIYKERISAKFYPKLYSFIDRKYKGSIDKYVDYLFKKSIFTNKQSALVFAENFNAKSVKKLQKDPSYKLYMSFYNVYKNKISEDYGKMSDKLNNLNRDYMAAQMIADKDKLFYPDANFTLRVSYGKVKGYIPRDGVEFKNYTTLEGIMQKDNPDIYDYRVPERLKELYNKKDYGQYEVNGTVPVCFVATNHTTGGNSGSPVVNANGELIGINFDRAWEGVMSDLMFNPKQCRNISLDVRYVLFLIDKFAQADYLLDEMDIRK